MGLLHKLEGVSSMFAVVVVKTLGDVLVHEQALKHAKQGAPMFSHFEATRPEAWPLYTCSSMVCNTN